MAKAKANEANGGCPEMTDDNLRAWANAHASGDMVSGVALAVPRVLDERDAARTVLIEHTQRLADRIFDEIAEQRIEIADSVILGLADRVKAQSEILSAKAEKAVKA